MYYKKLEKLYQESDLSNLFNIRILDSFDEFVRDEIKHGYQYLNPYKFALKYNLNVEDSIKIFLTFTDDDKVLKVEPFVDCNNCPGKKLSLDETIISESDGYVLCEDCGTVYQVEELRRNLYIYFKINDNIHIPDQKIQFEKFDSNSTYDVLQRMDNHLKVESPSSFTNPTDSQVEGGVPDTINLQDANSHNNTPEGKPRSESLSRLDKSLMQKLL